jgi:hypothetical protein
MTKHPEDRIYTVYEWVVEDVEGEADDREIIECYYFDEADRALAEAQVAEIAASGGAAEFGLCWRRGSEAESEMDRAYAYRRPDGSWPQEFDNGRDIPKRFAL